MTYLLNPKSLCPLMRLFAFFFLVSSNHFNWCFSGFRDKSDSTVAQLNIEMIQCLPFAYIVSGNVMFSTVPVRLSVDGTSQFHPHPTWSLHLLPPSPQKNLFKLFDVKQPPPHPNTQWQAGGWPSTLHFHLHLHFAPCF